MTDHTTVVCIAAGGGGGGTGAGGAAAANGVGTGASGAAAANGGGGPTSMDAQEGRFRTQVQPFFSVFTVLKYMVPLAVVHTPLKYQGGSNMNVFDENPFPVWCLLIATWLFYLIVGLLQANDTPRPNNGILQANDTPRPNNGIWFHALICAGTACGLISVTSSISIFIPRHYSFLPLVPVMVAAAFLAWPMLHYFYKWIVDVVNNTFANPTLV